MTTNYQISGNHRGLVVDNIDPLKQNRIRIRVHGFFDGVEDSHLPWAAAAFPLLTGSGAGFGWFGVPAIGATVFCFFEQGDYNQPVYFAEAPDGIHGHPTIADTNYPNRRGFRTSAGHIIYVDDEDDEILVEHSSGAQLSITGTVLKLLKDGASIQIDSSSNISITSSGSVTITGTTVNLNP